MADKKSFLLRLNPELWGELEGWAADEFRSVNGQIEYILHEAVRRRRKEPRPAPSPDTGPVPDGTPAKEDL